MIDGATKFHHRFFAVMLFLNSNAYFLELVDMPDRKADTISQAICHIIMNLIKKNLIVVALCTDNARNEKALLNLKRKFALQNITGLPLIRLPCAAHTANLGFTCQRNYPKI
jgi:hypothetical protein